MRIAIDAHAVGTGLGGNESYATNLIEALAAIDSVNEYTLYVTRREAITKFSGRWANFTVRQTRPHTPLIRIPVTLSAELRKNPVDVLHVQFTAPPFAPCPVVVSIHDLSFEHLPETFNRRSRAQLRLTVRRSARKAAHILALSEHARADIVSTYGIPPARVTAIPLAAADRFHPVSDERELQRVRHTYAIAGDYILTVGSIQPRKNLSRLILAYTRLCRESLSANQPKLVIVGRQAWLVGETLRAIRESGFSDSIILTGYVPDADLPALYSGAKCFVYPSFFEGFGLPPLEAMKCGVPVIAGNRTSLVEVVGDAGLLVDPLNPDEIAASLSRVLNNSDLREVLRVKGLNRSELFNWKETAKRTLEVYEQAVDNNLPPHF